MERKKTAIREFDSQKAMLQRLLDDSMTPTQKGEIVVAFGKACEIVIANAGFEKVDLPISEKQRAEAAKKGITIIPTSFYRNFNTGTSLAKFDIAQKVGGEISRRQMLANIAMNPFPSNVVEVHKPAVVITRVREEEEIRRLDPVLSLIKGRFNGSDMELAANVANLVFAGKRRQAGELLIAKIDDVGGDLWGSDLVARKISQLSYGLMFC